MRLPIGLSDFKELVTSDYLFVDKTLLAKDLIEDGAKVVLLTRPRRFGKTLNMSMLHYFFDVTQADSKHIFDGLNIAKEQEFCEQYQNKHPVIFISLKDVKKNNYEAALFDMQIAYAELYRQHRYLLKDAILENDEEENFNTILRMEASEGLLQVAIKNLSEYLYRKFGQHSIILIDEYDTPLQEAYLATIDDDQDMHDRDSYYNRMASLMRGIFGMALKDNQYLAKAAITGITRVAQESLFSGMNNIRVYSVLQEKFGQYFGFTEDEVLALVQKTKTECSMDSIKEWYNGYRVGKHILYNPWSITNCLADGGDLRAYWLNTGGTGLLISLIGKANIEVKAQFEALLQNQVIEQVISEDLVFADLGTADEALWSLLVYAGYLNVLSTTSGSSRIMARLAIPNKEVSFAYDKIVEKWFGRVTSLNGYDKFVNSLENGNMPIFKRYLSTYIMESGSYFDFNKSSPERIFHVFVLGLVVGLRSRYIINSNLESGLGRLDTMFLPKDKNKNGIIIEFKTCDKPELLAAGAADALQQIKDQQYRTTFRQNGVSSLLCIGLCFCGKEVELASEMIDIT